MQDFPKLGLNAWHLPGSDTKVTKGTNGIQGDEDWGRRGFTSADLERDQERLAWLVHRALMRQEGKKQLGS